MRKKLLHWICPFQAILSNFGFCDRKAPTPPPGWGKRDLHWIYPFRAIWATLVFVAEKPPPPRMREIFFTLDLSILCNFKQLWFMWQKSPHPQDEGKCLYTGSIHFMQFQATLVYVAEKPPPQDEERFFTLDLSISGNFEQLWFLVAEKPPTPGLGKHFLHWIYPF